MDEDGESDVPGPRQDAPQAVPHGPELVEQIEALRARRARAEDERHDLIRLQARLLAQRRQLWQERVAEQEARAQPGATPRPPPTAASEPPAPAQEPPVRDPGAIARPPAQPRDPLTAREREVLQLLVAGRANPQIARAMGISRATAKTHIEHILAKLGVSSRTLAAVEAVRRGLATPPDGGEPPDGDA